MTNLKAWLRDIGASSLGKTVSGIVLAHNLAQAIPWLVALAIAAGTGLYGALSSSSLLVALSVAVATGSSLSLLISFGTWYMQKRRIGLVRVVKEQDQQLAERDIDAENAKHFRLALQLILDLSTHGLVIHDPFKIDDDCDRWLRRFAIPNLESLVPGAKMGIVNWTDGHLRLACEGNLPHVIDRVLPKEAPRDFTECLTDIDQQAQRLMLFEEEETNVTEWLIVVAPGQDFTLGAQAYLGFVGHVLAAARRTWVLPTPV